MSSAETPRFTPAQAGLPFSKCVRIGQTLHLSGEIGVRDDGSIPSDFSSQARQTMDNIAATLRDNGLVCAAIVKCTIMLADMADWDEFNRVYLEYFTTGHLPIRSAFGANGLAKGALLEVECVASFDLVDASPLPDVVPRDSEATIQDKRR